jgi:hypothetical protein
MIVELYVYVDGEPHRVELFDDEKISVTQNVQNFKDIAKLFSDYSQSFTVPASPRNNGILKHWYESAIENGFDSRYRYDAFIKINQSTFKVGTIQLLSATIKDRQPTDYKITFYGKVKQIKDVLGDDKLSDLDYTSFGFTYSGSNVKGIIESAGFLDVLFPLLAHDRLYTYGGGASTDITTNTGAINWTTLFPAVRCLSILQLMELQYGFEFSQSFLYSDPFKYLYLLYKNAETMTQISEPIKVNFTSKTTGFDSLNLTTDEINFLETQTVDGEVRDLLQAKMRITPSNNAIGYRVRFYKNGVFYSEWADELFGQNDITITYLRGNEKITAHIVSNSPFNFTTGLVFAFTTSIPNPAGFTTYSATSATQSTNAQFDAGNYAPDLKLYDFFMGIVKMFNLVIIPDGEDKFKVLPLEEWYNQGNVIDLTEYTITESISVEQPKIFKELNFKHQKSESVTNYGFRENFSAIRGYDWGDLVYKTDFDTTTEKYEVSTPFEDVLFTTEQNFQWATLKNKTLENYIPKNMLMYSNLSQAVNPPIKYYDGSSTVNLNQYVRFSNERLTNLGVNASINFGIEKNVWNPTQFSTGLFDLYYRAMVEGLYNPKSRLIKCKMILPTSVLLSLKLNDKVVIKQKRYIINNLTTDLTTGETDLELISDFRPLSIDDDNRPTGVTNVSQVNLLSNNELAPVDFYLNEFVKFDILDSGDWLSGGYPTSIGNVVPISVVITAPENTDTANRFSTILATYYDKDDNEYPFGLPVIQNSYFPLELSASEEEITVDNTAQTIDPEIYIGLNQKMSIEMPTGITWATATDVFDVTVNTNFEIEIDQNTTGFQRTFFLTITYTSPLETVYIKLLTITQNA